MRSDAMFPVQPDRPRPDQEGVWDYPRPAVAEPTAATIRIELGGTVIAQTTRAIRTLETSHPPSYYIPPNDIAPGVLVPTANGSGTPAIST
jgi:uncharacterized protein (DUF427 family)